MQVEERQLWYVNSEDITFSVLWKSEGCKIGKQAWEIIVGYSEGYDYTFIFGI